MGCTTQITTSDCFYNKWKMCRGVYWALKGGNDNQAKVVMSYTGGACPSSGETKTIDRTHTGTFAGGDFIVKVLYARPSFATIEVWKASELNEDEVPELVKIPTPVIGTGKAEITQTNIGPGLIFNVGSQINYSLRVMNTRETGKIYGAIGLGYHDKEGKVYFTGRYANENIIIPTGDMFAWDGFIEVLHKDYAARNMTLRGPAVYFMAGHQENKSIVWDRSEYIPVELLLESGYVDPLDPEGVPDDWEEPVYVEPDPWGDFWDIVTPIPEPEPEPEKEPIDILPFIYIGFAGLIGYLLVRNQ